MRMTGRRPAMRMTGRRPLGLTLLLLASSHAHDTSGDADWLQENSKKEGVITLPSGLQYKVLQQGSSEGARPALHQSCVCHYTGSLIDGTVFDSSRKRGQPATFKPSGVIKGWTEALQLMSPGDRWTLYVPSELAYGRGGMGGVIPGGAVLIFDLELISLAENDGGMWDEIPESVKYIGGAILLIALYFLLTGGGGGGGKKVTASHILVDKEETCVKMKELYDQMVSEGKSVEDVASKFAEQAAKYSSCPSGKSGGSLGTFSPGQMVPAFDKVCWSAPIGAVQGPVQTQFGYHLILVTGRTMPEEEDKKGK